jgi:ankyrin repeat protein
MQALHFAARNGHAATCELLVRSGAALESGAAKNQATPLLLAVEGAHQFSFLNLLAKFKMRHVAAGHAEATSVLLQVRSTSFFIVFFLRGMRLGPNFPYVAWGQH